MTLVFVGSYVCLHLPLVVLDNSNVVLIEFDCLVFDDDGKHLNGCCTLDAFLFLLNALLVFSWTLF